MECCTAIGLPIPAQAPNNGAWVGEAFTQRWERAIPLRQQKIKGAARRSVRPKSREETPKEGNETSEQVASLASLM